MTNGMDNWTTSLGYERKKHQHITYNKQYGARTYSRECATSPIVKRYILLKNKNPITIIAIGFFNFV